MTMYGEARKLHLIEEILKIENDSLLDEVESLITKGKVMELTNKRSFGDFVGSLTDAEAAEIKNTIEDSCEQINPDDWK
jgi:hypothetical protein